MTVDGDAPTTLSVRPAAFIGVGAMLGAAGEVAGAAVWVPSLMFAANAIITAMVAVWFGSQADAAFADGSGDWTSAGGARGTRASSGVSVPCTRADVLPR